MKTGPKFLNVTRIFIYDVLLEKYWSVVTYYHTPFPRRPPFSAILKINANWILHCFKNDKIFRYINRFHFWLLNNSVWSSFWTPGPLKSSVFLKIKTGPNSFIFNLIFVYETLLERYLTYYHVSPSPPSFSVNLKTNEFLIFALVCQWQKKKKKYSLYFLFFNIPFHILSNTQISSK